MQNRFLILIVDRQHGHFYSFDRGLGRLTAEGDITDDVPKSVRGASWKGLADDRVVRHVEEHVRGHYQRVLGELVKRWREAEFEAIFLGGPEEDIVGFTSLLPADLRERVGGTFHPDHNAGIKELEGMAMEMADNYHDRVVRQLADTIQESRGPAGRGAAGREEVFEALNARQVQTLLINSKERYVGRLCPACGGLAVYDGVCPMCATPMADADNLLDALRSAAEAQSAEIIEVANGELFGPDEPILALKRYA